MHFKKSVLILLLVCNFFIFADMGQKSIIDKDLILYAERSLKSIEIGTLKKGEKIKLAHKKNGWYAVYFDFEESELPESKSRGFISEEELNKKVSHKQKTTSIVESSNYNSNENAKNNLEEQKTSRYKSRQPLELSNFKIMYAKRIDNIRKGSSSKTKIIRKMTKNEKFLVGPIKGNWYPIYSDKNQIFENDRIGYVYKKLLQDSLLVENSKKIITDKKNSIKDNKISFFSWILFIFIFLLLNYIIARNKAKNKSIIVISNKFDLLLIYIPSIIATIYIISLFLFDDDGILDKIYFLGKIIFMSSMILTVIFSIISNKTKIINIPISVFAKFFIMPIPPLLIILYLFISVGHKKDARYKDGTKGNSSTALDKDISIIANSLIFSLVDKS